MKVAFVGNHNSAVGLGAEVGNGAHATTESHWSASLELLGHEVVRVEEETTPWAERLDVALGCDMFLWTSTRGFDERWPRDEGFAVLAELRRAGIPSACVHLDRWRGLSNREWQVTDPARSSAMFAVDYCFTADGDSDDWFRSHDVRHFWLPPGVYAPECLPGVARDEYRSDVAFVGGWVDYGHAEHESHRMTMLDSLRAAFGDRVAFWPRKGEPGPWGMAYNDLLASTKVVVGDGWQGANRYVSNRAFETIGRGGFCVHPAIPGLMELLPEGMGVAYFPPGDWDAMCATIDRWVADDAGRVEAVAKGQAFVRENHTYTNRMEQMLATMRAEGAWR